MSYREHRQGYGYGGKIRRAKRVQARRSAWAMSTDKKCAVCGKAIANYVDYELDHKSPHSKGGKTELRNAQITYKVCNGQKSNKI